MLDRAQLKAALPEYAITRLIASGGFGFVVAGRHLRLDRPVAVKILMVESDAGVHRDRGAFAAEARLLGRLTHPHIVRVYDYVEHDDLCMIVMEHCAGGTLRSRVTRRPSTTTTVGIGLAVATALDRAHQAQIIHRDIKPANILFTGDGILKVSDFGIAKIVESTGRSTNTVIGTPAYMAPEQFTGKQLSEATDLYALATVLYELLCGRRPFSRNAPPTPAQEHGHEQPPPLERSVPPEIASAVLRALHHDPAHRPATASVFARDLADAATGVFGPSWLTTCAVPIHLTDEVREAVHRGPPSPPVRLPPPLSPATSSAATLPAFRASVDRTGTTEAAKATEAAASRTGSGGGKAGSRPLRRMPRLVRRTFTKTRVAHPAVRPPDSVDCPINSPFDLAAAHENVLFVSQQLLHQVSRVDLGLLTALPLTRPSTADLRRGITTFAGTGKAGRGGDGGPAAEAELDSPAGIALAPDGALYIADSLNDRLRRVSAEGTIATVAADLTTGGLHQPRAVTVGLAGVRYLADTDHHRVWRIDPGGATRPAAGTGVPGFSGDGGPATDARLHRPQALAVDAAGRLLIADRGNRRIRRVDQDGRIETIAGTTYGGRTATAGGPALALDIGDPYGLAVGPDGTIVVVDSARNQVLTIAAADMTTRLLASPAGPVAVTDPGQVTVGPTGTIYLAQPGRHCVTVIFA